MHPNAFIGKTKEPAQDELRAALGPAMPVWDQLVARLAADCNIATAEWNSYSPKYGWSMRLKVKKRNIVYLVPHLGRFSVAFIFGDRAMEAARQARLPKKVAAAVAAGKRYPEGTGIRLDVAGARDVPAIVKLAAIKLGT
jgi:hypothetical protein